MTLPAGLASVLSWWSEYYGDHHFVSVTTRFVHLAGIVVGGGAAISADRAVLRARRAWQETGASALAAVTGAHRVVLTALALVVVTGAMMTGADSETFLHSKLYWAKMAVFAVLLANGAALAVAEAAARRSEATAAPSLLVATSVVSLAVWLGLVWLGTWLTVAA